MIDAITIRGYKCLKDVSLDSSSLNIFAGPNSSGKSSTLQLLLLLRQSAGESHKIRALNLSGELYEGGTAADVLHPDSEYHISCDFRTGVADRRYAFAWRRASDEKSHARSLLAVEGSETTLLEEIAGPHFIYLNAERSRPKVYFELPADRMGLAGLLGKHGEFTAARLAQASFGIGVVDWVNSGLRDLLTRAALVLDKVDLAEELRRGEGRVDLVAKQLLGWIMPGAYFDATEHAATDTAVLEFVRDRSQTAAKVRPTHMGFGLTYVLPVIAAGLFSPPGGVVIVENPEAHMHPYSQSRLGVFLAIVAAAGRQVFVETHSDHVMNGVRVAVAQKLIGSEFVKTSYFRAPINGTTADVVKIVCDPDGRMSEWPAGFFDQIENDLSRL